MPQPSLNDLALEQPQDKSLGPSGLIDFADQKPDR